MSNYQLYLAKAKHYYFFEGNYSIEEAINMYLESSEDFKEQEAITLLGLVTSAGMAIGLPLMLVISLALNKMNVEPTQKIGNFAEIKKQPAKVQAIKKQGPTIINAIKNNNFKIKENDFKQFKKMVEEDDY